MNIPVNILAAAGLFVITLLVTAYLWYGLRGRYLRSKAAGGTGDGKENAKKAKKDSHNEKWGVDKESYCYPDINDVMQFEFVKVVKIPEGLVETKDSTARDTDTTAGDIPDQKEITSRRGMVSTVSRNGLTGEDEDNRVYMNGGDNHEPPTRIPSRRKDEPKPKPEPAAPIHEETEAYTELDAQTIEELNYLKEWISKEEEEEDERRAFEELMDENPDMIDPEYDEKENERISKDLEEQKRYEEQMNHYISLDDSSSVDEEFGSDIIKEINTVAMEDENDVEGEDGSVWNEKTETKEL